MSIYQKAAVLSAPTLPNHMRSELVGFVAERCRDSRLVFVGLIMWDVVALETAPPKWLHRVEVELAPAGERKPTSLETITALMSADEFRAVERRGYAL